MNILVTGATGFVGTALCLHLHEAGHRVVALSRSPEAAKRRMPWLDQCFLWASLTQEAPREAFEGVDAVAHLAGESIAGRWTKAKKQAILQSRVLGTRHLVAAMRRLDTRPRVLVSASAYGWYGDRGDDTLMEDEPPGDDFLAEVCRQWEQEATAAEGLGVRVVRLRNSLVLGPGGGVLAPQLPLYRLGLGGRVGNGRQWWPWIHQADLVRMVLYVIEQPIAGAVNATAPEPVRQAEFAATLGRVLGRPTLLPAPAWAVKLVLGEFAQELLSSRRVSSRRIVEAGFEFQFPTMEPALRDVLAGWKTG